MKKLMMGLLILGMAVFIVAPALPGIWTANQFFYKPSVGARGAAEKDTYDAGLDRVDARLSKEIWVGDPNYGTTIQDAVSNIGNNNSTLHIPAGTWNITDNLAIPANVHLKPERGAVFAITNGKTLTIDGGFEAGLYQTFSCAVTGKVVFGSGVIQVYPEWWGAHGDGVTDNTAAIQAALFAAVGKSCFFNAGTYMTTSSLIVPDFTTVEGVGNKSSIWQTDIDFSGLEVMSNVTVKNIQLKGNQTTYAPSGHCAIAAYYIYEGGLPTDPNPDGTNLKIENVFFTSWFNALWVLRNNLINKNTFISILNEPILCIQGGNTIINNYIYDSYSWGIDVGGADNIITNNIIKKVGKASLPTPLRYDGGGICINAQEANNSAVSNTLVSNNIIDDTGECVGIYVGNNGAADIDGLTISGNIISNTGRRGINACNVSSNLTNLTIKDNTVKGCTSGSGYGMGISVGSDTVGNLRHFVISGNNVSGIPNDAALGIAQNAGTTQYGTVNDNNLSGNSGSLLLDGALSDISVENNNLSGSTFVSIYYGAAYNPTNVVIKNNLGYASASTLLSICTVAPGTTAGKMKSTTNGIFLMGNQLVGLGAGDNLWDLSAITTGPGQRCKVALCVDIGGNYSVVKGAVSPLLATAPVPWVPCTRIIVGIVLLDENYAGGAIPPGRYFDTPGAIQSW